MASIPRALTRPDIFEPAVTPAFSPAVPATDWGGDPSVASQGKAGGRIVTPTTTAVYTPEYVDEMARLRKYVEDSQGNLVSGRTTGKIASAQGYPGAGSVASLMGGGGEMAYPETPTPAPVPDVPAPQDAQTTGPAMEVPPPGLVPDATMVPDETTNDNPAPDRFMQRSRPWNEVVELPEFASLPDEQKQAAKHDYFDTVIRPTLPDVESIGSVRDAFISDADRHMKNADISRKIFRPATSFVAHMAVDPVMAAMRVLAGISGFATGGLNVTKTHPEELKKAWDYVPYIGSISTSFQAAAENAINPKVTMDDTLENITGKRVKDYVTKYFGDSVSLVGLHAIDAVAEFAFENAVDPVNLLFFGAGMVAKAGAKATAKLARATNVIETLSAEDKARLATMLGEIKTDVAAGNKMELSKADEFIALLRKDAEGQKTSAERINAIDMADYYENLLHESFTNWPMSPRTGSTLLEYKPKGAPTGKQPLHPEAPIPVGPPNNNAVTRALPPPDASRPDISWIDGAGRDTLMAFAQVNGIELPKNGTLSVMRETIRTHYGLGVMGQADVGRILPRTPTVDVTPVAGERPPMTRQSPSPVSEVGTRREPIAFPEVPATRPVEPSPEPVAPVAPEPRPVISDITPAVPAPIARKTAYTEALQKEAALNEHYVAQVERHRTAREPVPPVLAEDLADSNARLARLRDLDANATESRWVAEPAGATIDRSADVATSHKRLSSMKVPGAGLAGKELGKLEKLGVDVEEARTVLDEYKNIQRSDFDSAQEFQEARAEAWSGFTDEVKNLDGNVATSVPTQDSPTKPPIDGSGGPGILSAHSIAGAALGFQQDENGNVTFDPKLALLGVAGGMAAAGALRVISKRIANVNPTTTKGGTPLIQKEIVKDATRFDQFAELPYWLAKRDPEFAKVYNAKSQSIQERLLDFSNSLDRASGFFELKGKDLRFARQMTWDLNGKTMEGQPAQFAPYGEHPNGRVKMEMNPAYEEWLRRHVDSTYPEASAKAKDGYVALRIEYDRAWTNVYNEFAKMREVDSDTIAGMRRELHSQPNYAPQIRYGTHYIKAKELNQSEVGLLSSFDINQRAPLVSKPGALHKVTKAELRMKPNPDGRYLLEVADKNTGNVLYRQYFDRNTRGVAKKLSEKHTTHDFISKDMQARGVKREASGSFSFDPNLDVNFRVNPKGRWELVAVDKADGNAVFRKYFDTNTTGLASLLRKAHPNVEWHSFDMERTAYREHVTVNPLNKVSGRTDTALQSRIDELRKKYPNHEFDYGDIKEMPPEMWQDRIPTDAMDQIAFHAVNDIRGIDEAQRSALRHAWSESMANTIRAKGAGRFGIRRENVPGFETEDVKRIAMDYLSGTYGMLSKMRAGKEMMAALREISSSKTPHRYSIIQKFITNQMRTMGNVDKSINNIKAIAFISYIGMSIPTAAANALQHWVTGIPRLSMDMHFAATRWHTTALTDVRAIMQTALTGKTPKNIDSNVLRMLHELVADGTVRAQFVDRVRGQVGSRLGQTWRVFSGTMGYPMALTERFQRATLGIAGYKGARAGAVINPETLSRYGYAKGEKWSHEDGVKYAKELNGDANYDYGAINAPMLMQSGSGISQAATASYTFNHFTYSTTMGLWKYMLSGNYRGKQAFLRSIAASVVLGGVTAIPMYTFVTSMFRRYTGMDPTTYLLKHVPEGPGDSPNLYRNAFLFGAPALTGYNISATMRTGSSTLDAIAKGRPAGEVMAALLGIPYTMTANLVKAGAALVQGESGKAGEAVAPRFIKNITASDKLSTEGRRTASGAPSRAPGASTQLVLTSDEAFWRAVGFTPNRLSASYEATSASKDLMDYRNRKQTYFADGIAKAIREKDKVTRKQLMDELNQWNKNASMSKKNYLIINPTDSIESRMKGRTPSKSERMLGNDIGQVYGTGRK